MAQDSDEEQCLENKDEFILWVNGRKCLVFKFVVWEREDLMDVFMKSTLHGF